MNRVNSLVEAIENNRIVNILRRGFVGTIPFLMVGSFSLMLYSLPIPFYQKFITTFCDGAIYHLFKMMSDYTLNCLALILVFSISSAYGKANDVKQAILYPIVGVASYMVFVQDIGTTLDVSVFSPAWTLTALVVSMVSCSLLRLFFDIQMELRAKTSLERRNVQFISSMYAIAPSACVIGIFAGLNLLLSAQFEGIYFQNYLSYACEILFSHLGRTFLSALLFVFLVHLMWFFGIHGSNVLYNVAENLFQEGMDINQELYAAGSQPTEIYTKTFNDVFVLMGGCGTALCIVIAIVIVSKNKNSRRLAKVSIAPVVFNISETITFGLPIIFNPVMLIPFIVVPIVMLSVSSLATVSGLVPIAYQQVHWTTPIILSGYLATGSVTGSVLQIVNIAIGTIIYIPFVKYMERPKSNLLSENIEELTNIVKESEMMGVSPKLLEGTKKINLVAQKLLSDMYDAVQSGEICVFYQPQVNSDGKIIGAEGLLRWKHPVCGYIYPPLVLYLAEEDGYINNLELSIIDQACKDTQALHKAGIEGIKISVNISPLQLSSKDFCKKVAVLINQYDFGNNRLAFEITERVALAATSNVTESLKQLDDMNIQIIMDDFGMGHSSMTYLQNNRFAYVKIDGGLVKEMLGNRRSSDIIASVCELADKLNFEIIAEYVETEEQRQHLESIGCCIYQGYLYSPAISLEELKEYIKR